MNSLKVTIEIKAIVGRKVGRKYIPYWAETRSTQILKRVIKSLFCRKVSKIGTFSAINLFKQQKLEIISKVPDIDKTGK